MVIICSFLLCLFKPVAILLLFVEIVALRNRVVSGRIGAAQTNRFHFFSLRHLGSDHSRSKLLILNFYSGVGWSKLFMCYGIRVRVMYFLGHGASLSLGRIGAAETNRFLF